MHACNYYTRSTVSGLLRGSTTRAATCSHTRARTYLQARPTCCLTGAPRAPGRPCEWYPYVGNELINVRRSTYGGRQGFGFMFPYIIPSVPPNFLLYSFPFYFLVLLQDRRVLLSPVVFVSTSPSHSNPPLTSSSVYIYSRCYAGWSHNANMHLLLPEKHDPPF